MYIIYNEALGLSSPILIKKDLDILALIHYIICVGEGNNQRRERRMRNEDVPLSECCGAPPLWGIHEGDGLCRDCKEHTEFTDEEGNIVQEW